LRRDETKKLSLYEINTRVWLSSLSAAAGRSLTLADVPEDEIGRIASRGFDLVWLMGVWRGGPKSVEIARVHPGLVEEYTRVLPGWTPEDVLGSPYAVTEYSVDPRLGGTQALAVFRGKLAKSGVGLILDLVPNHTARDNRWVTQKPEFYVQGEKSDLEKSPGDYFEADTAAGKRIVAHGRDPNFPGWTDTAQLNLFHPQARAGMVNVLKTIAGQCDGVRCDMAMLALSEVFTRTWADRPLRGGVSPPAKEFWSEAIEAVRESYPKFVFMAEAYWGLEGRLQSLGFDFTYDKTLRDRLLHDGGDAVRAHLEADVAHQERSVRFLENHDEDRAAAVFSPDRLRAAALIAGTVPGMTLYHDGQLEGRRVRVPVQLRRRVPEVHDGALIQFYEALLQAARSPVLRRGTWRLLPVRASWEGNATWRNYVCYQWEAPRLGWRLAAANFGPVQGQCYVEIRREGLEGKTVELADLFGPARYLRDGTDLLRKGLYLDMPAYAIHFFEVKTA
jgi:alpha amylase-like protein